MVGLSVDCVEAGEVSGLEPYDAVVLGSAVCMKGWRGDAKHLLRKNVQRAVAAAVLGVEFRADRRPWWR